MNRAKIPTIVGLVLLTTGLALGIFLVKNKQNFRLGASPETTPKEVKVTNITDSSLVVSWITDKETVGFIEWGEETTLGKKEPANSQPSEIHHVKITGLSANKIYFFKINSQGNFYGEPWQTKTGPSIGKSQYSKIISGTILNENSLPAENVAVYIKGEKIAPLSALSSTSGSWIIPLSEARTSDFASYIDDSFDPILEITAEGGSLGKAVANIHLKDATPVPQMTLGETYDFTSIIEEDTELPQASVNLPENENEISRFNLAETSNISTQKEVTLDSVKEGEVIGSPNPEFFGEAPSGSILTITVESEVISQELTIPPNGRWKWTPSSSLEEGQHKVTLTWRDAQGVLRTLTRNFVVQAAEIPSFVSSPSATISPTPTLTSTPTPTDVMPSTESGTPDAGFTSPSYFLLATAFLFIIFGGICFRARYNE